MATSAPKAAPKSAAKGASAPAGDEGAPVVKKKSKKKALLISIVTIVILAISAGAAFMLMGDAPPADPNAPQEAAAPVVVDPSKPPRFLVIEPFTVNLQADNHGEQFLQIAFSLQLIDEKQEELIKLYMPQARSRLLLLLSSKKASEISTIDGKQKLAADIVAQLKEPFTPQGASLGITNVFFTSFVIQ